jgi:hypothetical protein
MDTVRYLKLLEDPAELRECIGHQEHLNETAFD